MTWLYSAEIRELKRYSVLAAVGELCTKLHILMAFLLYLFEVALYYDYFLTLAEEVWTTAFLYAYILTLTPIARSRLAICHRSPKGPVLPEQVLLVH